jgi:hypothetical protein
VTRFLSRLACMSCRLCCLIVSGATGGGACGAILGATRGGLFL